MIWHIRKDYGGHFFCILIFCKKQRKIGVFCEQKTKKAKKFSTYIPSNNTTNSKFRKETKILSQKLKNFQKIQNFGQFS